jgi:hypothetical protein
VRLSSLSPQEANDRQKWPYYMRAYYAEHVPSPRVPGSLAIETVHQSEASMKIEVDAANSRDDIGEVMFGRRS